MPIRNTLAAASALLLAASCSRAPTAAPIKEASSSSSSKQALCFMQDAAAHDAASLKADALVLRGRAWVQKARNSGDPGFYLHADACAQMALAAVPEHTAALNLRALTLLNDHKFAQARDLAEAMLARDRDDVGAWATLSDALLELGDIEGASKAAQEMMDRKPSLPSYARASYLLWLKGDVEGALQSSAWAYDAGRGQKDHEPTAWVLTDAANIFWHKGDIDGARKGYEMALAEKADFAPALVGQARTLLAAGAARDAVPLLEQALQHAPSVDAAWTLAHAHRALGDDVQASRALDQAIAIGRAGDKRMLAVLLATLNRNASDIEEARRALDEDASAGRGGVYADDFEALVSLREGDIDGAKAAIARALALGTPDPRLLLHKGMILWKSGDASGKLLVEQALAAGAHNDAAMVMLAREVMQ